MGAVQTLPSGNGAALLLCLMRQERKRVERFGSGEGFHRLIQSTRVSDVSKMKPEFDTFFDRCVASPCRSPVRPR